jgi:hypothetical protein
VAADLDNHLHASFPTLEKEQETDFQVKPKLGVKRMKNAAK